MKDELRELLLNNIATDDKVGDCYDLVDRLDYNGGLHEIIDSNIDVYNYDLRKWAVDNYGYIEEALEEGLAEGVTDFHSLIQCGQYVQLTEQAHDYIEELFNEYNGKLFNVEEETTTSHHWERLRQEYPAIDCNAKQ